jgi:hypothetical protein
MGAFEKNRKAHMRASSRPIRLNGFGQAPASDEVIG